VSLKKKCVDCITGITITTKTLHRLWPLTAHTANCRPVLSPERAPNRYKTANLRQEHSDRKLYLVASPISVLDTKIYWLTVSRKVTSTSISRVICVVVVIRAYTPPPTSIIQQPPHRGNKGFVSPQGIEIWSQSCRLRTYPAQLLVVLCRIGQGEGHIKEKNYFVLAMRHWGRTSWFDNGAVRKPPLLFVCLSIVPPAAAAAVASSVQTTLLHRANCFYEKKACPISLGGPSQCIRSRICRADPALILLF
jgi:hypothetical protein